MTFSAVILAGGKSSRMGRDKAWLEFDGRALIARQVELLRQLPLSEVFISASAEGDFAQFGCPLVRDSFPGQGPLAGIEAAMRVMSSPLLLVMAVDMPRMTATTLRWLLKNAVPENGVVPRLGGQLEPLAAIYPNATHGLLREVLQAGQNAAHEFARHCAASGWVRFLDVSPERGGEFANCNTPAQWAAELKHD